MGPSSRLVQDNLWFFSKPWNTLYCHQFNYSSRIVFHIRIMFSQTENSAIRSADPENPTLEPDDPLQRYVNL